MLERFSDADLREICRLRLDNLESWLRRLTHDHFAALSQDYLRETDPAGNALIKKSISEKVLQRIQTNPSRFPRGVDALDFGELIDVICNPKNYPAFKMALQVAFPLGGEQAREVLNRLVQPRNRLADGNPISLRQAEQIVCYTGDTVDSLKEYYSNMGPAIRIQRSDHHESDGLSRKHLFAVAMSECTQWWHWSVSARDGRFASRRYS